MTDLYINALTGGLLIGTSASLLLILNGRIAGISGIFNGLLTPVDGEVSWRAFFIIGLIIGALAHGLISDVTYYRVDQPAPLIMILGGFLVGFGTRIGEGCTSGHGVCGLGRLSKRSFIATLTFMLCAMITLYFSRHVLNLT